MNLNFGLLAYISIWLSFTMQDTRAIMENLTQFALDLEVFFRPEEERVTVCFHTPINDDETGKVADKGVPIRSATAYAIHKHPYEDDLASSLSSASAHSYLETHDWSSETDSQHDKRGREYDKPSDTASSTSTPVSLCSSLPLSSSPSHISSGSDTDVW